MIKRLILSTSLILLTSYFAYGMGWKMPVRSDTIRYYAPCWGKDNKIYFIKQVIYGRDYHESMGIIGPYSVEKIECYLCSMNYDGTEKKEIVKISKVDYFSPTYWLPMYLDYCKDNDSILMSGGFVPSGGQFDGIWSIRADGTKMQKILDEGWHASWSPDGKKMVYLMHVKKEKRREDGWLEGYEDYDSLWIIDADGNNKHKIFSGEKDVWITSPIWSPNGDLIAFVYAGWIWVMKPDGSERRRVSSNYQLQDWFPDGSTLLTSAGLVDLNGNIVGIKNRLCGRCSLDGKMVISEGDFILQDINGKIIGDPISVGVPRRRGEHFVYKRPNNIW